jgi:hypothetical protein
VSLQALIARSIRRLLGRPVTGCLSVIAGVDPKVASDQRGHGLGVSLEVYTSSDMDEKLSLCVDRTPCCHEIKNLSSLVIALARPRYGVVGSSVAGRMRCPDNSAPRISDVDLHLLLSVIGHISFLSSGFPELRNL